MGYLQGKNKIKLATTPDLCGRKERSNRRAVTRSDVVRHSWFSKHCVCCVHGTAAMHHMFRRGLKDLHRRLALQ